MRRDNDASAYSIPSASVTIGSVPSDRRSGMMGSSSACRRAASPRSHLGGLVPPLRSCAMQASASRGLQRSTRREPASDVALAITALLGVILGGLVAGTNARSAVVVLAAIAILAV